MLESIQCEKGVFKKNEIIQLFGKYEIKSIKPDNIIDIFSSSLDIRYTDPRETMKVESFSLFE
jgi:hypothetical protein